MPASPKSAPAVTGWVVSHTHWDREWYWPFQSFRRRLVKVVDRVLDILETDPCYKHYTLDGQTIVLEDYLAIRPENRARIEALVRAERLSIGPWYVLPDEFIVSGEALARNILIGSAIAKSYGKRMDAGYIPDPFGHVAQLPQILDNFCLDSCIFTRGVGEEREPHQTEFWWEALDGTTVLAIHQPNTYCNACALGYEHFHQESGADLEKACARIGEEIESLRKMAATDIVLLNNGADHLMPQPDLPAILEYATEHLDGVQFVHDTFPGFVRVLKERDVPLEVFQGEMKAGRHIIILIGVWSARMNIKQANERAQTALENYAEPASALAWLRGRAYETEFLTEAWKVLISNHPHDSICGCSTDEVHRAMMPRFEESRALARDIQSDCFHFMAGRMNTLRPNGIPDGADPKVYRAIIAFNGLGQPYHGLHRARVEVPVDAGGMGVGGAPRYLRVLDADGEPIPSQVTSQRISESHAGHPGDKLVWEADLEFIGETPAAGHTVFHIEEMPYARNRDIETDLAYDTDRMSNAFLSVVFQPNGTFQVFREDWPFYVNGGLYEDTEDAGDEYNYSPAFTSKTVTSLGASATISQVAAGPVRAAYEIRQTLRVPKRLAPDRMARSEEMVDLPIVTTVSLAAGSRRVDVETHVVNNAEDHRLRALFETAERPDEALADTAFGVVGRPIAIPETEGWEEPPVGLQPMQRWFAVEGHADLEMDHLHDEEDEDDEFDEIAPHTGVAILQQGLPEYEAMHGESSTVMALTLFRSVGWLSRSGYPARAQGAGPKVPTPEAQLPGEHVFRYAIYPYEGTWVEANVPNEALAFAAPPAIEMAEEHEGAIPATQSYVSIEPGDLVLSALKKADDRDALIVRLYNPTDEVVKATVRFHAEPSRVEPVRMDEVTPDERVNVLRSGDTASFAISPARIVTLAVTFPGIAGGEIDAWTATPRNAF